MCAVPKFASVFWNGVSNGWRCGLVTEACSLQPTTAASCIRRGRFLLHDVMNVLCKSKCTTYRRFGFPSFLTEWRYPGGNLSTTDVMYFQQQIWNKDSATLPLLPSILDWKFSCLNILSFRKTNSYNIDKTVHNLTDKICQQNDLVVARDGWS